MNLIQRPIKASLKDTGRVIITYFRNPRGCNLKVDGVKPGDERLLVELFKKLSEVAATSRFQNTVLKRAFKDSLNKKT